eukprot:11063733-Alexandrium_andersonii.AAC.1
MSLWTRRKASSRGRRVGQAHAPIGFGVASGDLGTALAAAVGRGPRGGVRGRDDVGAAGGCRPPSHA